MINEDIYHIIRKENRRYIISETYTFELLFMGTYLVTVAVLDLNILHMN